MPSRRKLLQTAAALAAGGMTAESFATHEIPEKWDMEYDVVVVGFGGAGANAAISACESGAKTVILEKMPEPGGNTSVSAGNFLMCRDREMAARYFRRLFGFSQCELDEEQLEAFTAGMLDTVNWVKHLQPGVEVKEAHRSSFPHVPDSESMYACTVVGEKGSPGGPNLFRLYRQAVESRRIDVMLDTPARRLVVRGREVVGVIALHEGREVSVRAAKAVVLACGGYEYDENLKTNYNLGKPLMTLGCPGNTGDGVRMAQAAGAGMWHVNGLSATLGYPVPGGHTACQQFNTAHIAYILVDQNGKRFVNEKEVEHHAWFLVVNYFDSHSMKYPRIPCYAIFDSSAFKRMPLLFATSSGWLRNREKWILSKDNRQELELGIIKKADTLKELAGLINVPAGELEATVALWNHDIKTTGRDSLYGRVVQSTAPAQTWPPVERPKEQSAPLEQAPYYAVELYPTLLNTQGGPRHNAKCQVLDPFGGVIPRLYVAGELGSFWGFIYQGCGNNAEAMIFGRYAGRNAAAEESWS